VTSASSRKTRRAGSDPPRGTSPRSGTARPGRSPVPRDPRTPLEPQTAAEDQLLLVVVGRIDDIAAVRAVEVLEGLRTTRTFSPLIASDQSSRPGPPPSWTRTTTTSASNVDPGAARDRRRAVESADPEGEGVARLRSAEARGEERREGDEKDRGPLRHDPPPCGFYQGVRLVTTRGFPRLDLTLRSPPRLSIRGRSPSPPSRGPRRRHLRVWRRGSRMHFPGPGNQEDQRPPAAGSPASTAAGGGGRREMGRRGGGGCGAGGPRPTCPGGAPAPPRRGPRRAGCRGPGGGRRRSARAGEGHPGRAGASISRPPAAGR